LGEKESTVFYWIVKEETEQGIDIKLHIRSVALKLYELLNI